MGKSSQNVSVDKLDLLLVMLRAYEQSIEKTIKDCREANVSTFSVEGWPTLVRGLNFMVDQGVKITGPASPLARVEPQTLLMPGQEYYPTRKPSKLVQDKLDQAREIVEQEARRVADTKKPTKKPKDDTKP
jgi:hypothetical protein